MKTPTKKSKFRKRRKPKTNPQWARYSSLKTKQRKTRWKILILKLKTKIDIILISLINLLNIKNKIE
jgi:hypothetical protein